MDEDSISDLEIDTPPKLTFEEVKTIIFREPGVVKERPEILKAMYYYCKDRKMLLSNYSFIDKKHTRIIKYLFWPIIISFVQSKNNNKISLFGLRLLNSLIANETMHEQILAMGQTSLLDGDHPIFE